MKKIRKAVIPAAGLGTRFLPATKSMPKEMFTIIDTPTIQFIVEEATALKAAEKGYIQDVITEDELRAKLLSALEMLEGKRVLNTLPKKHNNIIITSDKINLRTVSLVGKFI